MTLAEQKAWFERILGNVNTRLKKEEEGYLGITMLRGKPRYYHCMKGADGKNVRKYLPADEMKKIMKIAQSSYDRKVQKAAGHQIDVINRFLREYDPEAVRKIRQKMSPQKRELVFPEEMSDEEFIEYWLGIEYIPGEFAPGSPVIMTDRRERVRSKSERDIANHYNKRGIPYRYEYPLVMSSGHLWHPDFNILNPRTREEFIHEHLGMMDDIEYLNKNLKKLELYQEDGYFIGDRLLITTETSMRPFDVRTLDPIIDKYFL